VLPKRREAWSSLIPLLFWGLCGLLVARGIDLWDAGDNSRFRYLIYAPGEDVSPVTRAARTVPELSVAHRAARPDGSDCLMTRQRDRATTVPLLPLPTLGRLWRRRRGVVIDREQPGGGRRLHFPAAFALILGVHSSSVSWRHVPAEGRGPRSRSPSGPTPPRQ